METEILCTSAEAVAMIKNAPAGSQFAVIVMSDAPIIGQPGRVYPHVCSGTVDLSRRAAQKLVLNMLSAALEAKGARIRMRWDIGPGYRCLWVS
jgi:N-acetylmuramic acid 6-phosphate (MurNAc-6-P) etherase